MILGVVGDAAVLQLSGCGTQSLSSGSDFDDVMKDPKATADEFIAAAGPPDEIVRMLTVRRYCCGVRSSCRKAKAQTGLPQMMGKREPGNGV